MRAADTAKYATKQMSSEDTMPIGIDFCGSFTSSPVDKKVGIRY